MTESEMGKARGQARPYPVAAGTWGEDQGTRSSMITQEGWSAELVRGSAPQTPV